MNRFISAMPSSMCWPLGENSQLKVEGMCSLLKVSASFSSANSPRRLTHAPRLVETVTSGEVVTTRSAIADCPRPSSLSSAPKPSCVDISGLIGDREVGRRRDALGRAAALACGERHALEEGAQLVFRNRQPFELVPFVPRPDVHLRLKAFHLRGRHQPGVIVLVAGERQPVALDGVGDEADRPVMIDLAERVDERGQVVTGEIGHQPGKLGVRARLDQPRDVALVADLVVETLAPGRAALEHQRRVELVRATVDPLPQLLAARLLERRLQQRAVLEDHHVPAEAAEQRFVARPQALADHRVEALAIVVDDPPAIAQALLPAFEDGLEDVALVELGVADERDHAAFRLVLAPAVRAHIVLHERGEQRLRDAQADRAGGEIDVVHVLGARGIALRALVAAEIFQLLARLAAEQILDGVKDRAGMRLDRHAVLRTQRAEIQRGHDGGERGGRRLVAADFQSVGILAQMIGVVDGPARQPQHLAFSSARRMRELVGACI